MSMAIIDYNALKLPPGSKGITSKDQWRSDSVFHSHKMTLFNFASIWLARVASSDKNNNYNITGSEICRSEEWETPQGLVFVTKHILATKQNDL